MLKLPILLEINGKEHKKSGAAIDIDLPMRQDECRHEYHVCEPGFCRGFRCA